MAQSEHINDELLDEVVLKHFPRGDGPQASLRTTSELHAILDEHMPKRWSAAVLAEYLQQRGYQRRLVGDELRWAVAAR